jgi:nitroreductase
VLQKPPISIRAAARFYRLVKAFFYDFVRFYRHSNYLDFAPAPDRLASEGLRLVHALEKGLVMPDARRPFGKDKIARLQVIKNLLRHDSHFSWLTGYIDEVVATVHRVNENNLAASEIGEGEAGVTAQQEAVGIPYLSAPKEFFSSRRSVRNFAQERVEQKILEDIVTCAQTAPSVCNRQGGRVRFYQESGTRSCILDLQNGNKGFGHLIPVVAVISCDLGILHSVGERNQAWVDGGIFAMNLALAIHAHGLGSCFLNWSATPTQDKQLRNLLKIPENEVIITLLALGKPVPQLVAESRRRPISEVWINMNPL